MLTEPGRIAMADWPEPSAGPHDVVVAPRSVGLCGTDLALFDGKRVVPELPWVMGHEGAGDIVAVGDEVSDRRVGQRVVIEPNFCCFTCEHCKGGRTSACPHRRIVGVNHPGLLAERVSVPAEFTWPVPATWSDGRLACIEPLAVARSAVRRSGVRPPDSCLVIGAGSQGLLVCQALLAIGAQPCVVEPHAGRLALAERLGARALEPDRLDVADFHVVFETSGAAAAWQVALDSVAATGTAVVIGMGAETVRLSTADLVRRQLTLTGALIYDHPRDFAQTIAAVTAEQLTPEDVVGAYFRPDDAAEAFTQARTVAGKSVLSLADWRGTR